MSKIAEEDSVRLITGGPEMKVIGYESEGYVGCSWTNKRNDEMLGSFPIHILSKIKK